MSAAATSWARGSGMRGSAQAVLGALAGFHNAKTGECRPGLNALCRASGRARATVCAGLDKLREAGLISWTKGVAPRGQRATNVYTLHMDSAKPRVQSPNFGDGEPKVQPRVQYSDVGYASPEFNPRTRKRKEINTCATVQDKAQVADAAPSLAGDGACCAVAKGLWNGAHVATVHPERLAGLHIENDAEKKNEWTTPRVVAPPLAGAGGASRVQSSARSVIEKPAPATCASFPSNFLAPSQQAASAVIERPAEPYNAMVRALIRAALRRDDAQNVATTPFVALPPKHPTPAQIDAAVAGAWARFDAMADPHNPEAWR